MALLGERREASLRRRKLGELKEAFGGRVETREHMQRPVIRRCRRGRHLDERLEWATLQWLGDVAVDVFASATLELEDGLLATGRHRMEYTLHGAHTTSRALRHTATQWTKGTRSGCKSSQKSNKKCSSLKSKYVGS